MDNLRIPGCQNHEVVLYGKQTQDSKHSEVHKERIIKWEMDTSTDVVQFQRIKESFCQKPLEYFMTINKQTPKNIILMIAPNFL